MVKPAGWLCKSPEDGFEDFEHISPGDPWKEPLTATDKADGWTARPLFAALTPAPQADALRFITLWRKTGEQCLDWDFYVSENAHELQQALANLGKQGAHQITTYRLGDKVEALADVLTESQTDAD